VARPIAIIDTDVIRISLDTSATDQVVQRRRAYISLTFERLEKLSAAYVIPSPVIAELCGGGPGDAAIREMSRALGQIRIQVLDEDAAVIAGEIARETLRNRAGRERGAVKFDTLIFAIAHQIGARWLVTGNVKDYQRCAAAISSPVEILVATDPPPDQQVMVEMLRPPRDDE
jgi:predicted nucleic acid-binding protein